MRQSPSSSPLHPLITELPGAVPETALGANPRPEHDHTLPLQAGARSALPLTCPDGPSSHHTDYRPCQMVETSLRLSPSLEDSNPATKLQGLVLLAPPLPCWKANKRGRYKPSCTRGQHQGQQTRDADHTPEDATWSRTQEGREPMRSPGKPQTGHTGHPEG